VIGTASSDVISMCDVYPLLCFLFFLVNFLTGDRWTASHSAEVNGWKNFY